MYDSNATVLSYLNNECRGWLSLGDSVLRSLWSVQYHKLEDEKNVTV